MKKIPYKLYNLFEDVRCCLEWGKFFDVQLVDKLKTKLSFSLLSLSTMKRRRGQDTEKEERRLKDIVKDGEIWRENGLAPPGNRHKSTITISRVKFCSLPFREKVVSLFARDCTIVQYAPWNVMRERVNCVLSQDIERHVSLESLISLKRFFFC